MSKAWAYFWKYYILGIKGFLFSSHNRYNETQLVFVDQVFSSEFNALHLVISF